MLIYWLPKLLLRFSWFQPVVPYLQEVFIISAFGYGFWAKVLISVYFIGTACDTGGFQKQGVANVDMDVDVDLYLATWLLFTVLALILASVFARLCGAEGGRPREQPAAETAQQHSPGDQEMSPPAEPSPAAADQQEETAVVEKPSPEDKPSPAATEREGQEAAKPSPVAAESIPQQLPAEPHEPKPQENAGDHAALPSKAEEGDLDSDKEQLVVREPASPAATPAPVTSTAASFESSEGFEWPLGTLEACLLIMMGITMLACIQSVFYPQPFRLVLRVNQSGVWALSGVRLPYKEILPDTFQGQVKRKGRRKKFGLYAPVSEGTNLQGQVP
ncbi:hypothetical protein AAES_02780 [Amazona aestiva]|uniref:Uncharacterized protein n=1 Tax=Amazona aestiva TaxID=12930 RepID=A0A0Q3U4T8_AMAAE|nr:hypothetical protein AAES_02780 [Amazona aestiva]